MLLLIGATALKGHAQTERIGLEECYQLARENYPAIKKLDLIAKTSQFDLQNASRRYLPQVSFSGQATYQSQTINFSDAAGSSPLAATLPSISKDQYKVQGEVNQLLYDGGATHHQKELITANAALQEQNLEANLYALKQRINTIYFAILLMDAQLKQNELNKTSLQTQVQKAEALLDNGAAFRSNVDELKAEIITIEMTRTEYASNRTAYLDMLSVFIGKPLPASVELSFPESASPEKTVNRPELKAFELQKAVYDAQERQLRSDFLPQVSAFFQGAYGRPTLNIIENRFGPWYITGVRFNWSLNSLYSLQNKRKILELNRESIDADKEVFLLNTQLDLTQQDETVKKYTELIAQDEQAIALRQSVSKSAEAQLGNGVITTHEYIQKITAEHMAQQLLILHQVQLLQAKYNQKYLTGN